ncbi:hypothetical protein [Streptomyces sp. NPDC050504]|uniref:hypothetical protein n=1 Tax=Streptomyces sp. NPDC050504 TaxID=3365618 RepID=UPI0037877A72
MIDKPRNTLADLAVAVAAVFVVGMTALLLPVPNWIGPALGGVVAVYALEARLGRRLTDRLGGRRRGDG